MHRNVRRPVFIVVVIALAAALLVCVGVYVTHTMGHDRYVERVNSLMRTVAHTRSADEAERAYKQIRAEDPANWNDLPADLRAEFARLLASMYLREGRYDHALEYEVEAQRTEESGSVSVDCAIAAYLACLAGDSRGLRMLEQRCNERCCQMLVQGCLSLAEGEYEVALERMFDTLECSGATGAVRVIAAFLALRCIDALEKYDLAEPVVTDAVFLDAAVVAEMREQTPWARLIIAYETIEVAKLCERAGWDDAALTWAQVADRYFRRGHMDQKADAKIRAEISELLERIRSN